MSGVGILGWLVLGAIALAILAPLGYRIAVALGLWGSQSGG